MPARDRKMTVRYKDRFFELTATYPDAAPWVWSVEITEHDAEGRQTGAAPGHLTTGDSLP